MSLEKWRAQIDEIDDEILTLLQRRAAVVAAIGEMKARAGLPVADAERESAIRLRIAERCEEPLSNSAVEAVFGAILQESRRIQTEKKRTANAAVIIL